MSHRICYGNYFGFQISMDSRIVKVGGRFHLVIKKVTISLMCLLQSVWDPDMIWPSTFRTIR